MKDKDLEMLYQGTDITKLEKPKERINWAYWLVVLGGLIWGGVIVYLWYLINKPL